MRGGEIYCAGGGAQVIISTAAHLSFCSVNATGSQLRRSTCARRKTWCKSREVQIYLRPWIRRLLIWSFQLRGNKTGRLCPWWVRLMERRKICDACPNWMLLGIMGLYCFGVVWCVLNLYSTPVLSVPLKRAKFEAICWATCDHFAGAEIADEMGAFISENNWKKHRIWASNFLWQHCNNLIGQKLFYWMSLLESNSNSILWSETFASQNLLSVRILVRTCFL